jgi:hypothetical protein
MMICKAEIMTKKLLILIFVFPFSAAFSQQLNLPLNRIHSFEAERRLSEGTGIAHSSFRPLIESRSILDTREDKAERSLFIRKVKHESLIKVDTGDFYLEIDPLFDFALTRDRADLSQRADTTNFYTNTRGVRVRGHITNKLSFETSFFENQSFFVNYLDSFVSLYRVVPGQGRVKDFKRTGFDYAMATGYVSYSPVKQLNLQFGHGRHFIGDGYRSMILSDNAFVSPYFRANLLLLNGRLNYNAVFTSLQTQIRQSTGTFREQLFLRKGGTFHHLNFAMSPKLYFGVFEGIIWNNSDGLYTRPVHPLFYNPLMFVNSAVFAGSNQNHVLNGITGKFIFMEKSFVYGQLLVDRLDFSRKAYQGGVKFFDLLGIRNLLINAEYNRADPFTYSFSNPVQSYTHYNQPLTHPLMANFHEAIGFVNYSLKDFFVELRFSRARVLPDPINRNSGNNIFISDDPLIAPPATGPVATFLDWRAVTFGYIINRKTNMIISASVAQRNFYSLAGSQEGRFINFSLHTALFNRYYDF